MIENENYDKSRVHSFSDAVFSIAMPLLVLEVFIPGNKELQTGNTVQILQNRIPSYIGLIVSFMVTALYWKANMRIFKFSSTIDSKILWDNFLLLFFILLLPFSTAFYVKGFTYQGLFAFCCFSLSAIGFFNLLLKKKKVKQELRQH